MSAQFTLRAISGLGAKGPACFLIETGGKRLLLDLGYGPQPGLYPNVDDVGAVDALILSHSHKDHIGGLSLMPKIGNPPIYATDITARRLPAGTVTRPLPVRGRADIMGIAVETGRNGHAPGGIWLRFAAGDGILYTGDYSTESTIYAYDAPPMARVAIIDSSYGDDDTPLGRRQEILAPHFHESVLLPAPADGRGPEIALHLARSGKQVHLDDATRKAVRELAGPSRVALRDGVATELAWLAETAEPPGETDGATLSTPADGSAGTSAALFARWENEPRPAIVFTGYIPPGSPADRLVKIGRAQFLRWNVHPRLRDTIALVRSIGADTVMPAFCDRKFLPALAGWLRPSNVTMDAAVSF